MHTYEFCVILAIEVTSKEFGVKIILEFYNSILYESLSATEFMP